MDAGVPVAGAESIRFATIIPAYRPDERLLQLLSQLSKKSVPAIILVDDGSGPAYQEIFGSAAELPNVRLVRHAVNLGKGAALKSAFNCALCAFPDLQGVITADAEGRHDSGDIQQVADSLAARPDRLVLGTRTLRGSVPPRCRVHNLIMRGIVRVVVGQDFSGAPTACAAYRPSCCRICCA